MLTLLYVASSTERDVLLEMLAEIVLGVSLRNQSDQADEFDEDLGDVFDPSVVLDPFIVDADEADLGPAGLIGPDTPMKITPAGEELLFVGFALDRWLRNSPEGSLELGTDAAGAALTGLACGWGTTAMHVLAKEPLTLEELNHAIEDVSYRVLEERVASMEAAGQVEAQLDADGLTRYAPTTWLREGIAPIVAATRLEHRHPAEGTAPPDSLDVEGAFLCALPLLSLPSVLSGSCQLALQMPGEEPHLAGVTAKVEGGRVVSCSTSLDEKPETWAIGSTEDWLETVVDPNAERVKTGGDLSLAGALLDGLHETLFGIQ